jgi:hypothetical protein
MISKCFVLVAVAAAAISTPALAESHYLKCDMQTTFAKRGIGDSEWPHREGRYMKFFRIDGDARMVSSFNARRNDYEPVCHAGGGNCSVKWSSASIHIDGRSGAADNATPDIDFRRAFSLTGSHGVLVVADDGGAKDGKPNMTWTQEGNCEPARSDEAKAMPYPPGPCSAAFVDTRVLPVSTAERDQALASRYHNTVTGLSGGSRWFHMWFLHDAIAYTGDDDEITAEGATRQWYVGKESSGAYRHCEHVVPPAGEMGCYPLNQQNIGDRWTEHDVFGDAVFELLPGRQ